MAAAVARLCEVEDGDEGNEATRWLLSRSEAERRVGKPLKLLKLRRKRPLILLKALRLSLPPGESVDPAEEVSARRR